MYFRNSLKIRATMAGVKFTKDSMSPNSEGKNSQENERRKFLTMKYGQQQIKLIQKRLKVEFWMDEQLNKLYEISVSPNWYYSFTVSLPLPSMDFAGYFTSVVHACRYITAVEFCTFSCSWWHHRSTLPGKGISLVVNTMISVVTCYRSEEVLMIVGAP